MTNAPSSQTHTTPASLLRVQLFGGFRVTLDQQPLDGFVSNKARALFAYLFITKKPQPRQVLAEMFWGDKRDAVANANLRVALSNLRAIAGPYLQIARHEVGIDPVAPHELDVDQFQNAVEQLSSRWQEIDVQPVEEAVALYRGDLLDGFVVRDAQSFDEWALWQRERLRQMALQALHKLSMHHTERGNYDAALKATRRLLDLEPWQEEGHRQMMLLLALTGNRSAALAQYETCRRILASELNVHPLPETNALLERIKAMPQASVTATRSRPKPTLFGREQEYAWLLRQWTEVKENRGRLTLVEGEMGIGKTRLVEEALREVSASNVLVLRARCHEFGRDLPFQPIADLLRLGLARQPGLLKRISPVWLPHLAAILPEVQEQPAASNAGPPSYASNLTALHLFEAVHQTLRALATAGPEQLAIFIDDLHWIDGATVDLLRYLVNRLAELPVWLVTAYQQDGIDPEHAFLRLRSTLIVDDHARVLRLERLPAAAIVDWISTVPGLGQGQQDQLTELILQRGQGNPFITSQILRELREMAPQAQASNGNYPAGNGQQLATNWPRQVSQIPFAVREIVLLKLNRLSPAARYLLCEAAALGEQFDTHALAWIEPQQPIAELLSECLEKGLITTVQPGAFRFVHPMMREIAAEWLSPWRRQRIGGLLNRADAGAGRTTPRDSTNQAGALHLPSPWPTGA
jgi:DNA-binding SARP family transcriptional activator